MSQQCCEQAPIMTSFGSRRGPGAVKWDYTAAYFRGLGEEATVCERGHIRGALIE